MPSRRELPRDFEPRADDNLSDTEGPSWIFLGHSESRPVDEFDALMRCAAHHDPEPSCEERLELRDTIVDAIDGLTEQERWIFDALFVRRSSLRALSRELAIPKTTLARWRDALLATLAEKLENDPAVAAYLEAK